MSKHRAPRRHPRRDMILCFLAGFTVVITIFAYGLWADWSWAR